jgi:glycosyltransferase involved in cell wall biosynthesis
VISIHQLVPALHESDAIGDSARAMRDYLRSRGFCSEIYSYQIDEAISGEARLFPQSQPELQPNDVLILHFALPSGMTDFLKAAPCRKAIIYHNITPAFYWVKYDPVLVHLATEGRNQLAALAPFVDRSAADSEFNSLELQQTGYRNICVLPIFVDQKRYTVTPSPEVIRTYNDGLFNFLFVGRVAPNKKLEDILKVYFYYKKLYDPLARVIFVGKTSVAPTYYAGLNGLFPQLGFMPEDIVFTGSVDWTELVAYYKISHVFLTMSEHEGFCVPLVESMICDLPIVAYSATAVPYTLGDSGVQFNEKDFPAIAAVCHKIRTDPDFREEIINGQKKQLVKYSRASIEKAIEEFLAPLI